MAKEKPEPEQRKILRVFRLMAFLYSGKRSVTDLAIELEVSERTVYRYINLLDSIDIGIEQDLDGTFFIVKDTCPLCANNRNDEA